MKKAPIPSNEAERLESVYSYNILDSKEEFEFDQLAELASKITDTPISLITLLDSERNWFKAHIGTDMREDARERSFCGHAIFDPTKPMIIQDATKDERFFDNPLVVGETQLHFYAGFPIVNKEGYPLGVICVMDHKARELNENQIEMLKALSHQALMLMEHYKKEVQLKSLSNELIDINKNLQEFANVVAHDLKSPVISIQQLVQLFKDNYESQLNEKQLEILNLIHQSSIDVKKLIDGTLEHTKNTSILKGKKKPLQLNAILDYAKQVSDPKKEHNFDLPQNDIFLISNEVALKRIFINLFSNAIRHNDKDQTKIKVQVENDSKEVSIYIIDNGPGIHPDFKDKIFDIYQKGDSKNKSGQGIGLASVKKLIKGLEGKISLKNLPGGGLFIEIILKK